MKTTLVPSANLSLRRRLPRPTSRKPLHSALRNSKFPGMKHALPNYSHSFSNYPRNPDIHADQPLMQAPPPEDHYLNPGREGSWVPDPARIKQHFYHRA
ncbi:hypothetical protein JCM6882_007956 [Rhodosporidiobolus microsporus]